MNCAEFITFSESILDASSVLWRERRRRHLVKFFLWRSQHTRRSSRNGSGVTFSGLPLAKGHGRAGPPKERAKSDEAVEVLQHVGFFYTYPDHAGYLLARRFG